MPSHPPPPYPTLRVESPSPPPSHRNPVQINPNQIVTPPIATPTPAAAIADLIRNFPPATPLAVLAGTPPWPTLVAIPGQPTIHKTPPTNPDDLFSPPKTDHPHPPLGWLCTLSYDIGRHLEPRASSQNPNKTLPLHQSNNWPIAAWVPLLAAWVYDHKTKTWHPTGDTSLLPTLPPHHPTTTQLSSSYTLGKLTSTTGRQAFIKAVASTVEQITAGVVFQANLAHQLRAMFTGSPRALFAELLTRSLPDCGCYLELPLPNNQTNSNQQQQQQKPAALLSLSPELFLTYDHQTRRVQTRPMKGTRRAEPSDPIATEAAHNNLERSPKERAELAMIIDLMRNDLGRVCDIGSINVAQPRRIEHHAAGQLLQAVGVVEGTLRKDKTLQSLLAAAFPPGSVTGAPKIRAMQLIDELEPTPQSPTRGPWCGTVGHIQPTGNAVFNVAIRTATITTDNSNDNPEQQTLTYPVGAGIVADSEPQDEWNETIAKASILLNTINQPPETIT